MSDQGSPTNPHRHGEYKVPGGKLVVVDLDVVDGHLANVAVAGDFFLEPDEALETMNRALTGMPADASAADIARSVDVALAAMPVEVQMMGLTTEGVGVAVRRALGHVDLPTIAPSRRPVRY